MNLIDKFAKDHSDGNEGMEFVWKLRIYATVIVFLLFLLGFIFRGTYHEIFEYLYFLYGGLFAYW